MSSPCPDRAGAGRLPCRVLAALAALAALAGALACGKKSPNAPAEERPRTGFDPITSTRIRPGPVVPSGPVGGPASLSAKNPYEGNVYAEAEGHRLYEWMNCVNCHGHGGGSIGPALWDDTWIYGSSPAAIAESIVRGRPNGMPAYGDRIPEEQLWKLVTYVRGLRPGKGSPKTGVM
jgi:cytochrome c oxidase cbb3-type subunit 3